MFELIECPNIAIAGKPVSLKLRYVHKGEPLVGQARLRIGYNVKDGAGLLQTGDPAAPGYLSVSTDTEASLGIDDDLKHYRSITFFPGAGQSDMFVLSIAVLSGTIADGDRIDIFLGNPKNEGGRFLPGNFADSPLEFFFSLDPDNRFAPKSFHPNAPRYTQFISADGKSFPDWKSSGVRLLIKPDYPIFADLILPTSVKKDEQAVLRIVVYDDHGNHIPDYHDDIEIIEAKDVEFRKTRFDTSGKGLALLPISFTKEQIYTGLKFKLANLGIFGANPVAVDNQVKEQVFWGEMHGHSSLSDGGVRGAAPFFSYARDIRGLDFAALADHAFGLAVGDHWEQLKKSVREFYEEDSFVSILGYEILTSYDRRPSGMGHRNIYFPDNGGILAMADYQPGSGGSFSGENIEAYKGIWNPNVPKTPTIEEFLHLMDGKDFLWTAHHCGNIDPVEESMLDLYEACSEWGISEEIPKKNTCTMMLESVFKGRTNPGLFGNSDDHTAKAAARKTATASSPLRYPSGLTAVFTAARNRRSIYLALKAKHCYATTGARILLLPEIRREQNILDVKLRIAGTAQLDKIWVYKNGQQVLEQLIKTPLLADFEWRDESFGENDKCHLRVSQMDGEMAWINVQPFSL